MCALAQAVDQFGWIVCAQVNELNLFFATSLLRLGNALLSYSEECGTDLVWKM